MTFASSTKTKWLLMFSVEGKQFNVLHDKQFTGNASFSVWLGSQMWYFHMEVSSLVSSPHYGGYFRTGCGNYIAE